MYYLFVITAALLFSGLWMIVSQKFNIEDKGFLYTHINKIHKWGEISITAVTLLLFTWLSIQSYVNNTPFKGHYFALGLAVIFGFRAVMEWKFDCRSKRYILSTIGCCIILILFLGTELIFTNPIPVRLEAEQVSEITIAHYFESEEHDTVILRDKEAFNPILNAFSNGHYEIGCFPITPRLEMIIRLEDGKEILVKELPNSTIFMVYTERKLFPKNMMMQSQELESIFNDFADRLGVKGS